MTHEPWLTAAECAECNTGHAAWHEGQEREAFIHILHSAHLQAQKDALYAAAVAAFGPEPIKVMLTRNVRPDDEYSWWDLYDALRAQREAKK